MAVKHDECGATALGLKDGYGVVAVKHDECGATAFRDG